MPHIPGALTASTQLPQFLLDHEIEQNRGGSASIIVTQPRRVAAIGVASRVANERMEDIDKNVGTVGYAIRGERRSGPQTKLLFCTTGVVLRRLGSGDPDLEGVSHVVVDEAHERGVDTDLLICLLRDLLERNKTIKVSTSCCGGSRLTPGHPHVCDHQRYVWLSDERIKLTFVQSRSSSVSHYKDPSASL